MNRCPPADFTQPEMQLISGMCHWLKHPPVLAGCEPGTTLEQTSKKRGVLIADVDTDFIHRRGAGLQETLGFFYAQVLQVVNQRDTSGSFETAFQGAFRNV